MAIAMCASNHNIHPVTDSRWALCPVSLNCWGGRGHFSRFGPAPQALRIDRFQGVLQGEPRQPQPGLCPCHVLHQHLQSVAVRGRAVIGEAV